jgi:hypothetical protein
MDAGIDRTYVSRLEHGLENPRTRMPCSGELISCLS